MAKRRGTGGKRAAGEGSFYQRPDGLWMGRVSLGRDSTGKVVRKSLYGKTQAEVRKKCDELRRQYESGLTNETVGTVAEFLDRWIEDDVKVSVGGNKTIREYSDTVKDYIKPFIGHIKLQKLTSLICRKWQAQLIQEGFTPNMRKRSLRVFNVALNAAIRADIILRNPLTGVPRPAVRRREIRPLTPDQCRALFDLCGAHRLGSVMIVAAMTGLRKGEIFALQWRDLNLRERVLSLRRNLEEEGGRLRLKEPKTRQGQRALMLDSICTQAFDKRREWAETEGFDCTGDALVFCNRKGGFLRQSNFDRNVWYPIRKKADIPKSVKFHDLRHTQATLMLAAGVHPKIVQERLGHGDISITMNTYSHILDGLQADAVERTERLIPESKAPKPSEAETEN